VDHHGARLLVFLRAAVDNSCLHISRQRPAED
jgi:hypothetical protein